MITKAFFLAKDIYRIGAKILRDHGDALIEARRGLPVTVAV
jgi:hypothetical protein